VDWNGYPMQRTPATSVPMRYVCFYCGLQTKVHVATPRGSPMRARVRCALTRCPKCGARDLSAFWKYAFLVVLGFSAVIAAAATLHFFFAPADFFSASTSGAYVGLLSSTYLVVAVHLALERMQAKTAVTFDDAAIEDAPRSNP